MKLLIIEDEQDIARPLKKSLEKLHFAVDIAEDGRSGLVHAQTNSYDCILLDLNLPKLDGVELARRLRKENDTTPIIMVTARSQVYNKLEGFGNGADDYVTKPFNLQELVARINAVIKRSSVNKVEALHAGNLQLVPKQNKVTIETNGRKGKTSRKEIELTNKETGLLEYLIRNRGIIVSTEEILEHVWDSEIDSFTDTVKTHIKTLRQKVDPNKKIIKTVRGKGYTIE